MSTAPQRPDTSSLHARLRAECEGEVLFDAFSRGRYSTDASIYQIMPLGVLVPRTSEDVYRAIQLAAQAGMPVLPRGGGTSQCGQTVGEALVIDNSKYLNRVLDLDVEARRVRVQPGITLDELNRQLKPHGLFFPVDVSTASRATIGGMAGNNSCGSRSIRYGNMVHNVLGIDAILADGERVRFADVRGDGDGDDGSPRHAALVAQLRALHAREAREIAERFPKLLRRVGGYNIDVIGDGDFNMAHLLVGSEGTLAYYEALDLQLQPIPTHKVLGVCHFPRFYDAMATTRHIVELGPTAVELVDRTMIELSREIDTFRPIVERFLRGQPDALLLVEFAGEDRNEQVRSLRRLTTLLADHGFPEAVVEVIDAAQQRDVWEVRKAGLNIMMSMKGDGKPVSFIEDCAVPLEDLAEYTDRLTRVFEKHGTRGTWYAHASVGCLHVRPILNMKEADGARRMRAIAEEAMEMVREYKGSHSGEHGDGLVRSEWHEQMFGSRITRAFEEVKDAFDPRGLMNPGKIVRPSKMDDRTLFRYPPGYRIRPLETALDWSAWGGFGGAVEMCNNNGACRKATGVMCPSYRATGDEQHLTRGRANTLRLALSGQLGEEAFTADEMYATMALCVGCKGCKRECPTGVDMARMKTEFLHHYYQRHRRPLGKRLVADLPRYAAAARRLSPLLALRNRSRLLARLGEYVLGISAKRSLPVWSARPFVGEPASYPGNGKEVVLFVDTFSTWFEPDNARAALAVLRAAGYTVHLASAGAKQRPLCCGRTYLAAGMVDAAREEARRVLRALDDAASRGLPVIGLEPACLLTLRDEFLALLPGEKTAALAANAFLLEEFLAREHEAGTLALPLRPLAARRALVHGHCHQKAFGAMGAVETVLGLIPELEVQPIESSCCGMAGAFGYEAEHYDVSMRMAEANLLPQVRAAGEDVLIVADGTSCRHQVLDGTGREALHVARVLHDAMVR